MKTFILASLSGAALWLTGTPQATAQEFVSTGLVQGVSPSVGALTIRSNQTSRPITFYGIERANIFSADGQPAVIDDIETGTQVTVQYAVRGNRWFISKVMLSTEPQGTTLSPLVVRSPLIVRDQLILRDQLNSSRALRSRAANDNDITTQPGEKADIDFDITTRSTGNAATDGDITTQPGSRTGTPLHRRAP